MRGLFLKIFLWFWLSHTLAVILVFLVTTAMQASRNEVQRPTFPTIPPSRTLAQYAARAAGLYESNGRTPEAKRRALVEYLENLQRDTMLNLTFFDAKGVEVSEGVEVSGRETTDRGRTLALRAAGSGETEVTLDRGSLITARRTRSKNGRIYVLVAAVPRRGNRFATTRTGITTPRTGDAAARTSDVTRRRFWRVERRQIQTAALLVALLLAAGIVSFGLARYLAAPTVKLRQATYQFASGDLSTRVGPKMGRRRDELADLGRDFDLMAERIESLMQSERRLLGDISHELRSPLARLQVALDLASQTADPETQGFLDRIERETTRLNGLIGHLLTLTRLEMGGAEARREPVNLSQLVNEVAADAEFEAQGQNRSVRVLHTSECWVNGSAELLRSAIENVVRNGVRYTREATTVEISLQCDRSSKPRSTQGGHPSQQAIIRIRDYGPGVPPEALGHLFRAFYRVADARDRQSGGVGLGLSITARAVHLHGGEVVASNAPEGGLLVEIRIPVIDNKGLSDN